MFAEELLRHTTCSVLLVPHLVQAEFVRTLEDKCVFIKENKIRVGKIGLWTSRNDRWWKPQRRSAMANKCNTPMQRRVMLRVLKVIRKGFVDDLRLEQLGPGAETMHWPAMSQRCQGCDSCDVRMTVHNMTSISRKNRAVDALPWEVLVEALPLEVPVEALQLEGTVEVLPLKSCRKNHFAFGAGELTAGQWTAGQLTAGQLIAVHCKSL